MPPQIAHKALIRVLRGNLKQSLRQSQLAQAEVLLAQLKDADPLSLETRGLELEYLIASRRRQEAEALADQLVRLFPSSARVHYLTGRIRYRQKDYARALEHFTESERLHPHWTTQRWLGMAHTQRGEYEAAEALLIGLLREHPEVGRDLAWLYERTGEIERALRHVEEYLALRPDDRLAQSQRLRLRASAAAPEELVQEVEELQDLGEEVSPEMLPAYVRRLLETGNGAEARRFVDEHLPHWAPEVAARIAWECHRLQAYDLALRLFLAGLAVHRNDYKYLSALESAALRCQRTGEVASAYRAMAPESRHLYGRLRALERRGK